MRRVRRPPAAITGTRESRAIAANLGRDTRRTRLVRRLTQAELGGLVGLGQSEISYLERGLGSRTSIETWVAIGIALGRPIAIGFTRDAVAPLSDAGHLAAQELVARIAGDAAWQISFEVPDDPRAPSGSSDLVLERPGERALVEIWNRIDDLGAAARSSDRKLARAAPGTASLWLFTDTAANHEIVRRYPAIVRARFPGSSAGWVRTVTERGHPLPGEAGLAWIDLRSGRVRPCRVRAG
jgi:transcriptional regulator with XRE-family HTH domain